MSTQTKNFLENVVKKRKNQKKRKNLLGLKRLKNKRTTFLASHQAIKALSTAK